ncbi:hypothetical protein [Azospirillum endophyticum]
MQNADARFRSRGTMPFGLREHSSKIHMTPAAPCRHVAIT